MQLLMRAEYHWLQLWKAIIGLLDFLGGKLEEFSSIVGIEQLLQEVCVVCPGPQLYWQFTLAQSLILLDIVFMKAEAFLSSPETIHEFIVSFCATEEPSRIS